MSLDLRDSLELKVDVNGRGRIESSYLEFLPPLFREDEFMGRFLLIFESILKPIENTVDNLEFNFAPRLAPEPLLPWLGCWVGIAMDSSLPITRRRELVRSAAELYRWRGTRRGLREYLRICTGATPDIQDQVLPGMRLGEARLGIDTVLGSSGGGFHFTVALEMEDRSEQNLNRVKAIIEAEKPAHTAYTLVIKPLARPMAEGEK